MDTEGRPSFYKKVFLVNPGDESEGYTKELPDAFCETLMTSLWDSLSGVSHKVSDVLDISQVVAERRQGLEQFYKILEEYYSRQRYLDHSNKICEYQFRYDAFGELNKNPARSSEARNIYEKFKERIHIGDDGTITIDRPRGQVELHIDRWKLVDESEPYTINELQASQISIDEGREYMSSGDIMSIGKFFTIACIPKILPLRLYFIREVLGLKQDAYFLSMNEEGKCGVTYKLLLINATKDSLWEVVDVQCESFFCETFLSNDGKEKERYYVIDIFEQRRDITNSAEREIWKKVETLRKEGFSMGVRKKIV